jgi:hypothetical protein
MLAPTGEHQMTNETEDEVAAKAYIDEVVASGSLEKIALLKLQAGVALLVGPDVGKPVIGKFLNCLIDSFRLCVLLDSLCNLRDMPEGVQGNMIRLGVEICAASAEEADAASIEAAKEYYATKDAE